jgi:hypothetical protein
MKWLKKAAVFLTVWILFALVAYGIALKDYSKKRFDQHQSANGAFSGVAEQSGRISWTDADFSKPQVSLKIEGSDDVLTLKKNIINDPQAWKVLDQFIRVGTKISVQTDAEESSKTIVQLVINPGNVFQKNIFSVVQASQNFQAAVSNNITLGRWYIGIGVSGLFMLVGVFFRKFKSKNGTTTKPSLYTS